MRDQPLFLHCLFSNAIALTNYLRTFTAIGTTFFTPGFRSHLRHTSNRDDGSRFKGQKRSNATHQSRTDVDARLYRKGNTESKLRDMGGPVPFQWTAKRRRALSTDCRFGRLRRTGNRPAVDNAALLTARALLPR
jgi:hypothetical protein